MYIEVVGTQANRYTKKLGYNIKFHEGPFQNKVFRAVDPMLIATMLRGIKIPFSELDFDWVKDNIIPRGGDELTIIFIDKLIKILKK